MTPAARPSTRASAVTIARPNAGRSSSTEALSASMASSDQVSDVLARGAAALGMALVYGRRPRGVLRQDMRLLRFC